MPKPVEADKNKLNAALRRVLPAYGIDYDVLTPSQVALVASDVYEWLRHWQETGDSTWGS